MALKKCKDCGNEVSTKAQACPKCGAPVNVKKSGCGSGCGTLVVVLLVLMIIGSIVGDDDSGKSKSSSSNSSTSKKSNAPSEIVSNSAWDASVYQVERYLEKNLKDPDSFEAIEWSPVQKVDLPSHKYIVRCKYRAKNSFGGYVIENQIFYLDKDGNVVNVMDWN